LLDHQKSYTENSALMSNNVKNLNILAEYST